MKLAASLWLCFSVQAFGICHFKSQVKTIYSLSGPITLAMRDLGLLKQGPVKGISIFHPISKNEFTGDVLPGGVFLSHEALSKFHGSLLFYDESRELTKMLRPIKLQSVEVVTRNLVPIEVTLLTVKKLQPFLEDCEFALAQWVKKTIVLEKKLLDAIPQPLNALFFLGAFRGGRRPELLIVNDGVVKWLSLKKKLVTYPSPLAYVNWSARVMASLPKGIWEIGIKDSGQELDKKIIRHPSISHQMTLTYPGSLIPGVSQLEAWLYLVQSL